MAAARKNQDTEIIVNNPVDIDFLNIPNPEDLINLDELVEPLVKIETYFDTPVILSNPVVKEGDKGGIYFLFDVQSIDTGETWKSSCSHWFMVEYVARVKKQGKNPFPVAVEFYPDKGNTIKFRGVQRNK